MKFHFDSNQSYQTQAVDAIINIFAGQNPKDGLFSIVGSNLIGTKIVEQGVANKLDLDDTDILRNVHTIQDRHGLSRSLTLKDDIYKGVNNFTIEMETGTGKTYVYIKTALTLAEQYGFRKFIIVVPSVAIREGVLGSFQDTQNHFEERFGKTFEYFLYDSSKLNQIKDFATSSITQIMIINIDAFRKSFADTTKNTTTNRIHRDDIDGFFGQRPIDILAETNPIVIIDEPQSVDNTDKAMEAIKSLNPLCILRYSATHRKKYNLIYQLGPVDAYQQKLVKRIQVADLHVTGDANKPYLKLISVDNRRGYEAEIELDIEDNKGKVSRKIIKANSAGKKDVFKLSGERITYEGLVIQQIDCNLGSESIVFENGMKIRQGEVWGATNDIQMKRAQIRATIISHLENEEKLLKKGIKVLSLFFIDEVKKYRIYNDDGTIELGEYGKIFEEEYNIIVRNEKYKHLFSSPEWKAMLDVSVEHVHNGYFSMDKKAVSPFEEVKGGSATDSQDSMFNLIMKEKARLLKFDTPLRFIFSHSALKEGWDNPNVFQVCTLVETVDTFTKRQKIGRGLRLPVDQDGYRIYDENYNILTVVANESYEKFAGDLQKEYEKENGIKFGYLTTQSFSQITIIDNNLDETLTLGYVGSEKIYNHFVAQGYITSAGKVEEKLKVAYKENTIDIPTDYQSLLPAIKTVIKNSVMKLEITKKNPANEIKIRLKKEVVLSADFVALWNQIKYKTRYQVQFNEKELIEDCIYKIKIMNPVPVSKIFIRVSGLNIATQGVSASDPSIISALSEGNYRENLPDILRYTEEHTRLKKSTLAKILINSGKLTSDFVVNPQYFMEKVVEIINEQKLAMIMQEGGVQYEKLGELDMFSQKMFEDKEIIDAFISNTVPVNNSVYDHVVYDSDTEKKFATALDTNTSLVKLFIKLPSEFKIDTPLGEAYNPDRAILIDKDGKDYLYFVVETKSTLIADERRGKENYKILCGAKHFEAIGTDVKYVTSTGFNDFRDNYL